MFQSECLSSTRFTTKIRIMLLALQDKSLFASFKFWSDLVMVGQSKLMPGSGYASDNGTTFCGLSKDFDY